MPGQLQSAGRRRGGRTLEQGWEDIFSATLAQAAGCEPQQMIAGAKPKGMFISPSPTGGEVPTPDTIGTPKLGYIQWGATNRLPNVIATMTSLLPYTATAAKFNVDVAAGMGFTPKYQYSAISNGALVTREIDYKDAGVLLEQQLIEARKELLAFLQTNEANEANDANERVPDGSPISQMLSGSAAKSSSASAQIAALQQSLEKRVECAEKALEDWTKTNAAVEAFVSHNNLPLLAIHLFNDMIYYNLTFPELELSRMTTEQPDNAQWEPRITGITYRDAQTCRYEKMDDTGRINYIYHSNRWVDQPQIASEAMSEDDMIAIPSLDPEHPIDSLRRIIRDYKVANRNGSPDNRPTRFILPSFIPSPGRQYYPQPSWHSIYGGDIYAYLSTIVSDRYTRRKNKNIIGHIIYVHQDYVKQLIMQRQQELSLTNKGRTPGSPLTQEESKQLLDEMWNTINKFLTNRDNAGQPLLAFTFTGPDGKDHDAYRIVDVPNTTAADAKAQKTELEEISAIVFFALQCHPELVGAVPGRTGAGGGTYQRELYLLKQCQIAPTQELVLRVLQTVSQFNQWDTHLVWRIRQQVLTTLDASKTGLTESQVK